MTYASVVLEIFKARSEIDTFQRKELSVISLQTCVWNFSLFSVDKNIWGIIIIIIGMFTQIVIRFMLFILLSNGNFYLILKQILQKFLHCLNDWQTQNVLLKVNVILRIIRRFSCCILSTKWCQKSVIVQSAVHT